jgi:glycosyltransferase involved in cell wall biosynthesis
MTCLILTPTALPQLTGNALTAERWRHHLVQRGRAVRVEAAEYLRPEQLIELIEQTTPRLIHAHHLFKSGHLLLDSKVKPYIKCPILVSTGGTDLVDAEGEWQLSSDSLKLCRRADAILLQSLVAKEWMGRRYPDLLPRLNFIPKGVHWLGHDPCDLKSLFPMENHSTLFFHPAGVRPVKNNLTTLIAFERALRTHPHLRLVLAGAVLDRDYGEEVRSRVEALRESVIWIEGIAPSQMASAYASADVVLNSSLSEGFSNSMLEAVVAGRPILASNIAGNRGVLDDPVAQRSHAVWFDPRSPEELADAMIRLADAPELRKELARQAEAFAQRLPTAEAEGIALDQLYRTLMRIA